jgi:hypothetical protein
MVPRAGHRVGYNVGMNAKEQLLEFVEGLSEEEATEKLPWMIDRGPAPALTASQRVAVERALANLDAGRKVSNAEMKRRFGIA